MQFKDLQPATEQLIKDAEAKAKYDRDIRMAGTKLGLLINKNLMTEDLI